MTNVLMTGAAEAALLIDSAEFCWAPPPRPVGLAPLSHAQRMDMLIDAADGAAAQVPSLLLLVLSLRVHHTMLVAVVLVAVVLSWLL